MTMPSGIPTGAPLPRSGLLSLSAGAQGYLIAGISAFLLAFTAIIIRVLTDRFHLPTFVLAFWRAALTSVVLALVLLFFKPQWLRLPRERVAFYASYGLLLALFNGLWTLSVALNGASIATILVYFSVGFTVFLGWIAFGEKLSARELTVIAVSLVGCFLVSNDGSLSSPSFNPLGLTIGILSAIGSTFYAVGGRLASERHYPVWNTILYVFGFSAIYQLLFNLVLALFPGISWPGMSGNLFFLSQGEQGFQWTGWWLLLILAAGPTLLGFGLYNISLKLLPLGIANLILSLELVFTALIAFALLGEKMSLLQIIGSTLVMGGVLLLRRGTPKAIPRTT